MLLVTESYAQSIRFELLTLTGFLLQSDSQQAIYCNFNKLN